MTWFRKVPVSNVTLNSIIQNFIAAFSGYTSYYATTAVFLTSTIYYTLHNAWWSDQYSVHRVSTDIYFICEMPVSVKVFTAASILSDDDSHFFPNQRKSCSCSLLNVCTTSRYEKKYQVENLRDFVVNPVSNSVCLVAWNVLSSQRLNMKFGTRRNFILILKRRPSYFLSLTKNSCGGNGDVL